MKVEIFLECTVEECRKNIGCMCRLTKGVAINHHGVCVVAGGLPGFQKTSDNKEENSNCTQQLKAEIRVLADGVEKDHMGYCGGTAGLVKILRELSAV